MKFFSVFVFIYSGAVFAQTGADVLLNTVSETVPTTPSNGASPVAPNVELTLEQKEFPLKDGFQKQLFSEWKTAPHLSFEVQQWVQKVLKEDFEGAAHLWTVVSRQVPEAFKNTAEATQLYVLYQLKLPQIFIEMWLNKIQSPAFLNSRAAIALEQVFVPEFENFVKDNALVYHPHYDQLLKSYQATKNNAANTLLALGALRKGEEANVLLPLISEKHFLKMPLTQSASIHFIKNGKMALAGQVLKAHLEPAVEATKNPEALSQHYLNVARMLFQVGALDAAQEFYEKIPDRSPDFLAAREERAWILLRKGDLTTLRGELKTLASPLFEKHFLPESYVVRAISNLKLCYYDAVESDLNNFVRVNKKWAQEVEAALKLQDPPEPTVKDFYSNWAKLAVQKREEELNRLKEYTQKSVQAALPAVGEQPHWKAYEQEVQKAYDLALKNRAQEYRRFWSNRQLAIEESIRKMRFVRVEFLSQVRKYSQALQAAPNGAGDSLKLTSSSQKVEKPLEKKSNEIDFKFEGVIWPDELFKIRSKVQSKCLEGI